MDGMELYIENILQNTAKHKYILVEIYQVSTMIDKYHLLTIFTYQNTFYNMKLFYK